MINIKTLQTLLWLAFLLYYCFAKFSAGYQGYSHAYALQVALIVTATAIIPFYLSSWLAKLNARAQLPVALVMPSVLALAGYASFYFVFIAPNYPQIGALQVIPRGFEPGIVISVILVLPFAISAVRRPSQSSDGIGESEVDVPESR